MGDHIRAPQKAHDSKAYAECPCGHQILQKKHVRLLDLVRRRVVLNLSLITGIKALHLVRESTSQLEGGRT